MGKERDEMNKYELDTPLKCCDGLGNKTCMIIDVPDAIKITCSDHHKSDIYDYECDNYLFTKMETATNDDDYLDFLSTKEGQDLIRINLKRHMFKNDLSTIKLSKIIDITTNKIEHFLIDRIDKPVKYATIKIIHRYIEDNK